MPKSCAHTALTLPSPSTEFDPSFLFVHPREDQAISAEIARDMPPPPRPAKEPSEAAKTSFLEQKKAQFSRLVAEFKISDELLVDGCLSKEFFATNFQQLRLCVPFTLDKPEAHCSRTLHSIRVLVALTMPKDPESIQPASPDLGEERVLFRVVTIRADWGLVVPGAMNRSTSPLPRNQDSQFVLLLALHGLLLHAPDILAQVLKQRTERLAPRLESPLLATKD